MRLKKIAAMLIAAVMVVSLAACGANTKNESLQENGGTQAVHLNLAESWGFEYFYTIITPEVSSSSYDITYYLTSFYDTLFEYNADGEVVGVLAEDWSMSEDGKVYTFQIKQGVKFSDGSDLTAEDVAKSILAVPVNLGQYNGSYGRLSTIIEDAVATDEYTVELHLTQPYYNTLRELCLANPFGIVSSEQFNDDLTAKQESFRSATYGTGPYMYAGDNDGQTWNFVRNPNYWGEAPEVDSFSIKYIPDNDAKILAMQNGEVDFLSGIKNISAESYAQMEQMDGYGAQVDEKSLQTYYVGYNLSSEIFGDQVVREAISSAIDKDAVVDNIYGGLFDKADTFFSRDLPYCDVEQTVYGFDLDHANQILDEAGYVDTDGDGIREKDGVKLSAAFLYQTGTASDDNMVVYICDQASKIGIELTPQSAQMMDWYAMIQSGDYGLTIFKTQGGAAARAAQCEEFIQRLPQGYQTNIGENGSTLSGGERQRISIARALLKNAPIVLLDEATASMDAESETLVQDALSVLLKDKTVMVIAHRMRTVANADKIVVLDDGKVSEMGTPAELMAKGGLYSHLVALQQGR